MKVENLIDKITFNKKTEQSINNQTNQIDPLAMLDNVVGEKEINKIKVEKNGNGYRVILTYDGKAYDYLEMIKDYLNSSELDLLSQNNLSVLTWEQVLENSTDNKDYTEIKIHKISKSILEGFKDDIGEFNKGERQYFGFANKTTGGYVQILIDLKTGQFVVGANGTGKRTETTLFNIQDKYLLYTFQKSIGNNEYKFNIIDLSKGFNNNQQPTKFPIGYSFSHSHFSNRTGWNNNIGNNKEFFEVNGINYVVNVDKDNMNVVSNITVEEEVKGVETLGNVWKDKNSQLFIYKSITKNKVFIINKSLGIKKDISNWFDNIEKYSILTVGSDYHNIDTNKKTLNILIKNFKGNGELGLGKFILLNYETLKIVREIENIPNNSDYTIIYSSYVLGIIKENNGNLIYAQNKNGKYYLNIEIDNKPMFGKDGLDMTELLKPLGKYYFTTYDYYGFYKKFNVLIIEPKIDYQREYILKIDYQREYILKIKDEVKFLKDVKFIDRQENKFIIRYENKEDVYSYIGFSLDKNGKVKIKEKTLDLTKDKDKIQLMETREGNDYFYMKEGLAKIIKSEDLYN